MPEEEFLEQLKELIPWKVPKIELMGWADVLDRCDELLAAGVGEAGQSGESRWILPVDAEDSPLRPKLTVVLNFMTELFENTTSRTCFASIERLIALLDSSRMDVIRSVLAVLQTIARRTQLMGKLSKDTKALVAESLVELGMRWERPTLTLSQWATAEETPPNATNLLFEYAEDTSIPSTSAPARVIKVDHRALQGQALAGLMMGGILARAGQRAVPERRLLAQLRLRKSLHTPPLRRLSCIARLQAIQILLYSTVAPERKVCELLHEGLVEELVDVLRLPTAEPDLVELKCEVLRTLTAVIHFDRTNKLESIVDLTNANSYHGFLPGLVRSTMAFIMAEESGTAESASAAPPEGMTKELATAVLSFIYHLSNYEPGREALVQSGLVESLLQMVSWSACPHSHMQYVTRSVRLIDIMLHSIDVPTFINFQGFPTILKRFQAEVDACRVEEPYVMGHVSAGEEAGHSEGTAGTETNGEVMEVDPPEPPPAAVPKSGLHIHPRRAALIKSLQNFIKRVIVTPDMAELTRTLMSGSMPRTLGHIISNCDYYGAALFLQSMEIVQSFVQQEPGQLSALQERGLTTLMQKAILERELPPVRDVLLKLPSIFQSLCLNDTGRNACVAAGMFDKLFKIFLNVKYLNALKRTKRGETLGLGPFTGDTVADLGNAMEELIKHHAQLRPEAMKALVAVLDTLHDYATSVKFKAVPKMDKKDLASEEALASIVNSVESSDSDGEHTPPTAAASEDPAANSVPLPELKTSPDASPSRKVPVPLPDYLANVAKFTDALLFTNIGHSGHIQPPARKLKEFTDKGGGEAVIKLVLASNLSPEMAASSGCLAPLLRLVHNVLTQAQNAKLIQALVEQMGTKVLGPLVKQLEKTKGNFSGTVSILLDSLDQTSLWNNIFHLQNHLQVMQKLFSSASASLRRDLCQPWLNDSGAETLRNLVSVYLSLSTEIALIEKAEVECRSSSGGQAGQSSSAVARRLAALWDEEPSSSTTNNQTTATEPMDTSSPSQSSTHNATSPSNSNTTTTHPLHTEGEARQLPSILRPQMGSMCRVVKLIGEMLGALGKLSHPRTSTSLLNRHQRALTAAGVPAESYNVAVGLWKAFVPQGSLKDGRRLDNGLLDLVKPLLFDEHDKTSTTMLRAFYTSGAHTAVFKSVEEMCREPVGSGKLVDAISLLEKLCSPEVVLENNKSGNSHFPPPSPTKGFSSLKYLIQSRDDAHKVLNVAWNSSEFWEWEEALKKMLELEKNLITTQPAVDEAWASESRPDAATTAARNEERRRQMEALVDAQALSTLLEMGFERDAALEALEQFGTAEAAAEYLLSEGARLVPGGGGARLGAGGIPAAVAAAFLDDEEQMRHALQLSLAAHSPDSDAAPQQNQPPNEGDGEGDREAAGADVDNVADTVAAALAAAAAAHPPPNPDAPPPPQGPNDCPHQ